jgi:hypothetical protein
MGCKASRTASVAQGPQGDGVGVMDPDISISQHSASTSRSTRSTTSRSVSVRGIQLQDAAGAAEHAITPTDEATIDALTQHLAVNWFYKGNQVRISEVIWAARSVCCSSRLLRSSNFPVRFFHECWPPQNPEFPVPVVAVGGSGSPQ